MGGKTEEPGIQEYLTTELTVSRFSRGSDVYTISGIDHNKARRAKLEIQNTTSVWSWVPIDFLTPLWATVCRSASR